MWNNVVIEEEWDKIIYLVQMVRIFQVKWSRDCYIEVIEKDSYFRENIIYKVIM